MEAAAEIIPYELDAASTDERNCSRIRFYSSWFYNPAPAQDYKTMNVFFNSKKIELPAGTTTVADLLEFKEVSPTGIAVAVNNKVVSKAAWDSTPLNEGDKVLVIAAVCGG